MSGAPLIELVPWGPGNGDLLAELVGDEAMMRHLGGPESPAKIRERQARYEAPGSGMYKIVEQATGLPVGSVGFWERPWRGAIVFEMGWSILPAQQRRGYAALAAGEAVRLAARSGTHRFVHAFPSVENSASNAICRKLGFELLEERDFEYPPGHWMRCNDWRLDLRAVG